MDRRLRFPLGLALALVLVALPRVAVAQDPPPAHQGAQACPAGAECPMKPDHEAMMARRPAMMEQHAEAAARLQALQDRMHQATGEARVDAIAALLDEMLSQHRAMHQMMMGTHQPMQMDHGGMKEEPADSHDHR